MSTYAVENIFSAELAFVPLFNLALQQNAIPVVYELKLINNTGNDIENLECRFSAVPEFIHEKSLPVSKVKAGEELAHRAVDFVTLDEDLLHVVVYNKVNITLTVTQLGVLETVIGHTVLVLYNWQWTDTL